MDGLMDIEIHSSAVFNKLDAYEEVQYLLGPPLWSPAARPLRSEEVSRDKYNIIYVHYS